VGCLTDYEINTREVAETVDVLNIIRRQEDAIFVSGNQGKTPNAPKCCIVLTFHIFCIYLLSQP
jgi:hypothetical protein